MGVRGLVGAANEQDKVAGQWLLKRLPLPERLRLFIFDSAYDRPALLRWFEQVLGWLRRSPIVTHPAVLKCSPNARLLGWLHRFRRLSNSLPRWQASSV